MTPSVRYPKLATAMQYGFWFLLFIVFPLVLNPQAIFAGDASRDQALLIPKATALALIWFVGLFAALLSYPNARLLPRLEDIKRIPNSFYFLAFTLLMILVSSLSTPYAALPINLIGTEERFDGALVQILWYSLAFLGAALMTRTRVPTHHLMILIAVSNSLVAVWVLLQGYGIEPLVIVGGSLRNQNVYPVGPIGNSGLVGGYLATLLLVLLGWLYQRSHAWIWYLPLALSSAALIMSENRAGVLAVIVVWVGLAIYGRTQWRRMLVLSGVVIVAGIVVVITHPQPRALQFTQTVQAVRGTDQDTNSRLLLWSLATDMLPATLWIGLGPQGFEEGLWAYTDDTQQQRLIEGELPENAVDIRFTGTNIILYRLPNDDQQYGLRMRNDKAHNYLLDLGISAGLLAVIAFLIAYGLAIWHMFHANTPFTHALAAGMLGYGIFGMTWFASLAVDPVVCGLLGAGIGASFDVIQDNTPSETSDVA